MTAAFSFGSRSLCNLGGVHPDLVRVARRALEISTVDFVIIEGARTLEKEKQEVACGKSETLHSRHIPGRDGFAHALDFVAWVDGEISWDEETHHYYSKIAAAFLQAGAELKIPVIWGGSWMTLKDYDHIELNRNFYPD